MDKDVLNVILEEIRELKKKVDELNEKHYSLKFKVYAMAFIIGGAGGKISKELFSIIK